VQETTLHVALLQSDGRPEATYTVTAHKLVGKSLDIARATGYTVDGVAGWTPNACYGSVPLAQADISPDYDTQAIDKASGDKVWTITTIVREWLAAPTTNAGLVLNADASALAGRYRHFASMEHPTAQLRPSLKMIYSVPIGGGCSAGWGRCTATLQSSAICLIGTAGFPATSVFGGTDFVTTEPAATTELSPIVTPRMTMQ
jgi:hypothetical protein